MGNVQSSIIYSGNGEGVDRHGACARAEVDAKSKLSSTETPGPLEQPCKCSSSPGRSQTNWYCSVSLLAKSISGNPSADKATSTKSSPSNQAEVYWYIALQNGTVVDAVGPVTVAGKSDAIVRGTQMKKQFQEKFGATVTVQRRGTYGPYACAVLIKLPDGRVQERWGTDRAAAEKRLEEARRNGRTLISGPICRP